MTQTPVPHAVLTAQRIGYVIVLVLVAAVVVSSARFLLPTPPLAGAMQSQLDARPIAFVSHVACGIVALVLGAVQFTTRTGQRRAWHRAAGKIYVATCLTGAVTGFYIAWFSFGGPVATTGFVGLATAWFVTTAMGFRAIVSGQVVRHRRWMVRSYAVTLAAVTLRLMLPVPLVLGIDFVEAYRVIAFLSWIPNIILAEIWLAVTAGWRLPGVPIRV